MLHTRMTSPGLGKEVGASLGVNRSFYQGFFLAPTGDSRARSKEQFLQQISMKNLDFRSYRTEANRVRISFRR